MSEEIIVPEAAMPADPALAAMMGAMGSGGDPIALLMSQFAPDNPQAALVMRLLEQRRQAEQEAAQQPAKQDDEDGDGSVARVRREDFDQLRQSVEQASAELDALHQRMAALAGALGACPRCFGDDPDCATCGGRGRPGARAPDHAAFRHFVLPAVKRAQAIESYRKHAVPPQHSAPEM